MAALELTEAGWNQQVAASPLPVAALFWAPWCMPCRTVLPYFERAASAWEGRARLGLVDAEVNQRLARRFGIQGLPTLLVLRGGEEVTRRIGLIPEEHLEELLESVTGG